MTWRVYVRMTERASTVATTELCAGVFLTAVCGAPTARKFAELSQVDGSTGAARQDCICTGSNLADSCNPCCNSWKAIRT